MWIHFLDIPSTFIVIAIAMIIIHSNILHIWLHIPTILLLSILFSPLSSLPHYHHVSCRNITIDYIITSFIYNIPTAFLHHSQHPPYDAGLPLLPYIIHIFIYCINAISTIIVILIIPLQWNGTVTAIIPFFTYGMTTIVTNTKIRNPYPMGILTFASHVIPAFPLFLNTILSELDRTFAPFIIYLHILVSTMKTCSKSRLSYGFLCFSFF